TRAHRGSFSLAYVHSSRGAGSPPAFTPFSFLGEPALVLFSLSSCHHHPSCVHVLIPLQRNPATSSDPPTISSVRCSVVVESGGDDPFTSMGPSCARRDAPGRVLSNHRARRPPCHVGTRRPRPSRRYIALRGRSPRRRSPPPHRGRLAL